MLLNSIDVLTFGDGYEAGKAGTKSRVLDYAGHLRDVYRTGYECGREEAERRMYRQYEAHANEARAAV